MYFAIFAILLYSIFLAEDLVRSITDPFYSAQKRNRRYHIIALSIPFLFQIFLFVFLQIFEVSSEERVHAFYRIQFSLQKNFIKLTFYSNDIIFEHPCRWARNYLINYGEEENSFVSDNFNENEKTIHACSCLICYYLWHCSISQYLFDYLSSHKNVSENSNE